MNVPVSEIDFYSDAVISDPYPVYAELRDLGPVVYLKENDLYLVARYAEVSEVLLQPLRFVSSRGVSPIPRVNDILVGSTLNSDPPAHDKTRSVTAEPLLPGSLTEYEPQIKAAADGLIDMLCDRGEFDAVADLAQYLPVTIVAELVGLPVDSNQMLKWASATFNLFGTENERTTQAFADLQDLRDFLLEYGKPEKLKDGGWAKRIFQTGSERGIPYETCAQLMRDYINPSLDTTISVTGQMIKFFADNPEQWDKVRADASFMPNAVEEAVRMSTPIRAFTRYAIEDIELAGHIIPMDSRIVVVYASANRDPRKFPDPDKFDVTRDVHDHVGFGQGVHMCMGMHLARREMILLVEALRRRVERFELLEEPDVAMNNTIRAYSRMPVKVHLSPEALADASSEAQGSPWIDVSIDYREDAALGVVELHLASTGQEPLPTYEAGAHVDVHVKSGVVRQYSLTGDPNNRSRYRLGILLEPDSRGGSASVHSEFEAGTSIRIGRPRNNFPLQADATYSVLFAGGIGITPILAMAYTLESQSAHWELHYCGHAEDRLAFIEELAQFGDKVKLHIGKSRSYRAKVFSSAFEKPSAAQHAYVCGPNGFIDAVVQVADEQGWQLTNVHVERFGAEVDTDGAPFAVVAQKSGKTFEVSPGETIASQLALHGIDVEMSCQSGVCGTCLTNVVSGTPDHRDMVQTDLEKAANTQVTVCCSRSKTKSLVLDL